MAFFRRKRFARKRPLSKRRPVRARKAFRPRRPRYFRSKSKSRLSVIKVKCHGQVQPYGRYKSIAPYWKGKLEKLYFSASRNTYQQLNNLMIASWVAGSQSAQAQTLWSVSDITNMLATVNLGPAVSGNIRNTSRVYLQKCYAEYIMTNSTNYPIEFSIYLFHQKRDAEDSVVTLWNDGIQDMTGNALTAMTATTYGQTPMENPAINQFLKLHKVLHYNVNPGQTFKYSHESNLFRLFNVETIATDLQSDAYLKGITETILFVAKGAPSQLTTGANAVGVSGGNVACINTKKYQFKYIQDVNWNTNEITNLSTTGTNVLNPTGYGTTQTVAGTGI